MAPGKDSIYLLSGIAVCADSGALTTRKVSTANGKKYVYYMCSNNKKNKKCSSHRIKGADLESRVFDTLRDMTAILLDADEVIAPMMLRRVVADRLSMAAMGWLTP